MKRTRELNIISYFMRVIAAVGASRAEQTIASISMQFNGPNCLEFDSAFYLLHFDHCQATLATYSKSRFMALLQFVATVPFTIQIADKWKFLWITDALRCFCSTLNQNITSIFHVSMRFFAVVKVYELRGHDWHSHVMTKEGEKHSQHYQFNDRRMQKARVTVWMRWNGERIKKRAYKRLTQSRICNTISSSCHFHMSASISWRS